MPKIETLSLKTSGSGPVVKKFEFADPNNPGVILTVNLRRLGVADQLQLPSRAAEITAEYVTGSEHKVKNTATGKMEVERTPPKQLAPLDGQPLLITGGTAQIITILMASQVDAELYTVEEWARILACDAFAKGLLRALENHTMANADMSWMMEDEDESPLAHPSEPEQPSTTTPASS